MLRHGDGAIVQSQQCSRRPGESGTGNAGEDFRQRIHDCAGIRLRHSSYVGRTGSLGCRFRLKPKAATSIGAKAAGGACRVAIDETTGHSHI